LLRRLKTHDQAAWERLVSLYSPLVYLWCQRAGLSGPDVEDVGQEVFCAVWKKIGDFHHDQPGDTFRGWLRVITSSKLHDRGRRGSVVAVGGEDVQTRLAQLPAAVLEDSDGVSEADEVKLLVRRAVDLIRTEFADEKWQAFYRVVVEGQQPADVARDLNISVNVVYLAKSRVLRRLREEFSGLVDGDLL